MTSERPGGEATAATLAAAGMTPSSGHTVAPAATATDESIQMICSTVAFLAFCVALVCLANRNKDPR